MEIVIAILVVSLIGGFLYIRKEKKKLKKREEIVKPVPTPPAPKPKPLDPCRDLRDGTFNPHYSPQESLAHGYFWCSVQKMCTNQSSNVNICGQQPHLVG